MSESVEDIIYGGNAAKAEKIVKELNRQARERRASIKAEVGDIAINGAAEDPRITDAAVDLGSRITPPTYTVDI